MASSLQIVSCLEVSALQGGNCTRTLRFPCSPSTSGVGDASVKHLQIIHVRLRVGWVLGVKGDRPAGPAKHAASRKWRYFVWFCPSDAAHKRECVVTVFTNKMHGAGP